jgi:uncharacterized protein YxeA
MKILKMILFVIIGLIAVVLIAALFIKKNYNVEREITINKTKSEVFDYLKHLKNQDNYSKWVRTDPNMKRDFRGTDGTVGFVYAWDGNKQAGKGEQEIKNIVEGEKLDVEVRFEKPFKSTAYAPMVTEAISDSQTRVKWGLQGTSTYPMNFMNLFMDKILGKDIETSLTTLKGILEK